MLANTPPIEIRNESEPDPNDRVNFWRSVELTGTIASRLINCLSHCRSLTNCIDWVKLDSVMDLARELTLRKNQAIRDGVNCPDASMKLSEIARQIKKQRDEIETLLRMQPGDNTLLLSEQRKLSEECESLNAKIRLGRSIITLLA